jgi:hypothetical protein
MSEVGRKREQENATGNERWRALLERKEEDSNSLLKKKKGREGGSKETKVCWS